ncbi:MAG: hypothetical protein U1F71_25470 [Verrucomicrobiaceae bacterium]
METIKAHVVEIDEKHFINIKIEDDEVRIPISEDKPNEVKSAFNKLIARIKVGEFEIMLEGLGQDLFSQVANEYVSQLNREIQEVRVEMGKYNLVQS